VICILGFQFQIVRVDNFFVNPFYIGGMLLGILVALKAISYFCPECQKSQIILSPYKYRLPSKTCHHCGYDIDNNRT
jgi:predicted RNA-binding Zn-ribbon protein involved in translation (DUF1610 family)